MLTLYLSGIFNLVINMCVIIIEKNTIWKLYIAENWQGIPADLFWRPLSLYLQCCLPMLGNHSRQHHLEVYTSIDITLSWLIPVFSETCLMMPVVPGQRSLSVTKCWLVWWWLRLIHEIKFCLNQTKPNQHAQWRSDEDATIQLHTLFKRAFNL